MIIVLLAYGGYLVAIGENLRARELAKAISETGEAAGRTDRLIESALLQALAYGGMGDLTGAREQLEAALELGEPEGFLSVFTDAGPGVAPLIHNLLPRDFKPEYIGRILKASSALWGEGRNPRAPEEHHPFPAEPLSRREREILRKMSEGLSNQEIADALYISLQTVKVHTRNIYGKLEVNSRIRACAVGRSLGILS